MLLYYSFIQTVAFNQWIEETKQMKTNSLFLEGITSVVLNVSNSFKQYHMGQNPFLREAENGGVS